jgi:hypothetical protein
VWRYNGWRFVVQDDKSASVEYIEGELPYRAAIGDETRTLDLLGPDRQFASFSYFKGKSQAFIGRYEDFSNISFTHLRPLAGW